MPHSVMRVSRNEIIKVFPVLKQAYLLEFNLEILTDSSGNLVVKRLLVNEAHQLLFH